MKEWTTQECESLVGKLIYIKKKLSFFPGIQGTYLVVGFVQVQNKSSIVLDRNWHRDGHKSFNKHYLNYVDILEEK